MNISIAPYQSQKDEAREIRSVLDELNKGEVIDLLTIVCLKLIGLAPYCDTRDLLMNYVQTF